MTAYYNEIDPSAAAWLRELIKAGVIAHGDVDTRSIEDVTPNDVRGYTQCHWFAGVGGWSLALRMAGWPDDKPVWTGSCPCQSFSSAGKGLGFSDKRHLWPIWHNLINQCKPKYVFGEQVASALVVGKSRNESLQNMRFEFAEDRIFQAHGRKASRILQELSWMGSKHGAARLWTG